MSNLFEDNKDIESIIKHLDSKILELRRKNILKEDDEIFIKIREIYTKIGDWMKDYNIIDQNMYKEDEQDLINNILDVISLISEING